jgi:hypothetical protein
VLLLNEVQAKRKIIRALDEIKRIVKRVREGWPEVEIWFRGDSDFSRDEIMTRCEQTEGVEYLFSRAENRRLEKLLAEEMAEAKKEFEVTGRAAHVFGDFQFQELFLAIYRRLREMEPMRC